MMATRPDLRVGDAERDSTATLLREHYAQGRLSTDELSERLDVTFSATTQGQLAEITHDLPHLQAAPPVRRPAGSAPPHSLARGLRNVVTLLAVAAAVLGVVIIAQHGDHLSRAVAELVILLLVLRAVIGRHAGRRHREQHAARYSGDEDGSDEYSDRGHHSGRSGRQFHEHHHDHHHGQNGRSYRYSYRYEWSDGSDRRDGSDRSGQSEQSEQIR